MTNVDSTNIPAAKPRRVAAVASRNPKAAPNKSDIVVKLLARLKGTTIAEVSHATGWQAHSVRAFFSGLRKRGSALEREARKDGTSSYRLLPRDTKPATVAAATTALASNEGTPAVTDDEA